MIAQLVPQSFVETVKGVRKPRSCTYSKQRPESTMQSVAIPSPNVDVHSSKSRASCSRFSEREREKESETETHEKKRLKLRKERTGEKELYRAPHS